MRACARSLQCSHFNRVLAGPSLRRREDQIPGYAEAEVMSQAAPLPLAARAHADMAGLKNCASRMGLGEPARCLEMWARP